MTKPVTPATDLLGLHRIGYSSPLFTHPALRWEDRQSTARDEQIAEEVPIVLAYNGQAHVVMMATPGDLEDFITGFSLTEELVENAAELQDIEVVRYGQGIEVRARVSPGRQMAIEARSRKMSGRTGCGICGTDSIEDALKHLHPVPPGGSISSDAIQRAISALAGMQPLNRAAGAVHAAGWATLTGDVVLVREDVGRHNALDKVIGALIRQGIDTRDGFLVVTSRASFEMVQKATVLGARALVAISGPTGLAVRVAQQAGLTLVGFARPGRFTVYTHESRIVA
ncbi:MAG TPA: formate dehydrogenase accessory sulfurtransferase FdhD [Gemmatimonadales bacterium]|nr:formate dehydrogenase accessory sulfurtransferase FdhD [Gemmatimonadales bacterium]